MKNPTENPVETGKEERGRWWAQQDKRPSLTDEQRKRLAKAGGALTAAAHDARQRGAVGLAELYASHALDVMRVCIASHGAKHSLAEQMEHANPLPVVVQCTCGHRREDHGGPGNECLAFVGDEGREVFCDCVCFVDGEVTA